MSVKETTKFLNIVAKKYTGFQRQILSNPLTKIQSLPGYGGWQAIDATPQEKSSGLFQCGPAPLEAVKQGVIGLNYDVGFMVATVNADLMRWRRDPESETQWSRVDTNSYQ